MNITDVIVRRVDADGGYMKASVSVVIDNAIAVHDIRVIAGPERLFIAMPTRKTKNGYHDIVAALSEEARQQLEDRVLDAYENAVYNEVE